MKSVKVWIRAAAGVTALALTLGGMAACGGSKTPSGSAATSAPATAGANAGVGAAPVTSGPATTTSQPAAPVLADGRSAVYLTGLDTAAKTTTFDLIEFLTGNAAKAEWKKEHPEQPDGPDNDYLIVNNNKKLRTLPVDPKAKCVVLATLGGTATKTVTFAALPAFLTKRNKGIAVTPPQISMLPFWLTVKRGTVTGFEEQFLP